MIAPRLIVFAKRPVEGRVKTRLVPALGARPALELYRAMLLDTVHMVKPLAADAIEVEISFDEPWHPDGELEGACAGLLHSVQGPGDLGDRLLRALERSCSEGPRATVIVGADAPTFPRAGMLEAIDALARGADAIVAPSGDGGYVLVGASRPVPPLFRDIPWGGPEVLAVTRVRARAAGIALVELPGGNDVDVLADLDRLRRELDDPVVRRSAPATAAWVQTRFGPPRRA